MRGPRGRAHVKSNEIISSVGIKRSITLKVASSKSTGYIAYDALPLSQMTNGGRKF
jgi:hypothetical protein